MTEKEVIRIALSCFNISYDKIGDDSDEVSICKMNIRQAESICARYSNWTFLLKRKQFTSDDSLDESSYRRMDYCYQKPSGMVKILYVNGRYNENISVIGDKLFTSVENPEITYICDIVDYDTFPYPDLYGYLIAYTLASLCANFFRPDDQAITTKISNMFNFAYQSLISGEFDNTRKKNPSKSDFVVGAPSESEYELYK